MSRHPESMEYTQLSRHPKVQEANSIVMRNAEYVLLDESIKKPRNEWVLFSTRRFIRGEINNS